MLCQVGKGELMVLVYSIVLEACATSVVAAGRSGNGEDDLLEDADDEEDEEDEEEEDELEIVLFRLLDTALSFSISSNLS